MRTLAFLLTWLVLAIPCSAKIIYVDADATGANDGSSWTDAYNDLWIALTGAPSGTEIRVAQGIYKSLNPLSMSPVNRMDTFQLKNGVTIKGGYAGFGEPDPDARDISTYVSVLSGDIAGNDDYDDIASPKQLLTEPTRADNSYHVVTAVGVDANAVLDGFTITGGQADGGTSEDTCGGGMYSSAAVPMLSNCTFSMNCAKNEGGGMYNDEGSNVIIVDCKFMKNAAERGGGVCNKNNSSPILTRCTITENSIYYDFDGAGMANFYNSNPILSHCKFIGNMAPSGSGAGMYNYQSSPELSYCEFVDNVGLFAGGMFNYSSSSPKLSHCTFINNSADLNIGGGMYNNNYCNPTLQYCTFKGNSSNGGGGMHNYFYSSPTLANCQFIGNSASYGGGGLYNRNNSSPTMTNCIFSGNSADDGGGAMCNDGYCAPIVKNCTFSQNSAPNGNAMVFKHYYGGSGASEVQVTNSILWDGGDEISNQDGSTIAITYSNVQSGWPGEGNIDADPCFVEPGNWDVNGVWVEGDYHLLVDSVCINAGDPDYIVGPDETDLDGNPRVTGSRIDMGAYEFQGPRVIYVDADASGANNGSSWADAYNYLQDALMVASAGAEIRVAEGTYKPDEFVLSDRPNFGRMETFQLKNGLAIKGGYAGFGEPDPDARDVRDYETILSGDIGISGDNSDNSLHVVTAIGVDANAVLDGFSITGGAADGETNENKYGGGMYNYDASPVVKNCKFGANSAISGGAIGIRGEFQSTLTDCGFENNIADLFGGAIYCTGRGELSIIRCEFRNGTANRGGVIYNGYASLIFSQCILVGNQAEYAGAISTDGDITLTNCLLANNHALVWGGALANMENTSRSINCTFVGNSANYGGAIFSNIECDTIAINSIFWDNTAQTGSQIATSGSHGGSTLTVNYCDIENLLDGLYVPDGCTLNWEAGNVDVDPCFVEPGYWDANGAWVEGDYHLLMGSVCINAGDPNYIAEPNETDLDGKARVLCGRIDMGAYEFHCPKIVYVDADAMVNNDGSSWADAYNLLQDAIAAACEGDEIRVARGIYKPDQGGGNTSGDREATFQLKNDLTVKGGYAGFGEKDPDARDIKLYETVLSGDLAGNDAGDLLDVSRGENSYHVVTGSGTDASAVLDGFTITGGNAYNDKCSSYDNGGGMYNNNGSPTVANCTFTRNTASDQCGGGGAGMYNFLSSPTVINCEFIGNEYIIADDDGGGGMCNNRSNPTLIDCSFRDNKSNGYGGGMLNYYSHPTLTNCVFINNSSAHEGGGMENRVSSPTLTYCAFIGNSSYRDGGGLRNKSWCSPILIGCEFIGNTVTYSHSHGGGISSNYQNSPTLINCLLTGNSAQQGGGMYTYWGDTMALINCTFSGNSATDRGGAMYYRAASSTLTNCIVWGNTALQGEEIYFEYFLQSSTMTVSYCDIKGGKAGIYVETGNILDWGEGNIGAEPMFADSGNGNYRLSAGSPCVDAGDNDSVPADVCDLDGKARIYDGDGDGEAVVDMGAYELGLPPIEVPMKLVPQALNPGSQGNWVKAHFVLPGGFTVDDVDTNRPAEIEQLNLASDSMEVFVNEEGFVAVMAVFDRKAFCSIGPFEGEIMVVGYLTSGRGFRGTDTIKIVTNKIKHLAVLAANWLSVCGGPDWCDGVDLDQDSVVNFVDFALMDGCCFEVIKD